MGFLFTPTIFLIIIKYFQMEKRSYVETELITDEFELFRTAGLT